MQSRQKKQDIKEGDQPSASKGEKKSDNLWKTILQDVACRDTQKDMWMLLLGDQGCGKSTLLKTLNQKHILGQNSNMQVDQMGSAFAAVDFSFLYCKDLADRDSLEQVCQPEDNLPKMNVLTLHNAEQIEMTEAVIGPEHMENLVATIVLDLEQPWDIMNNLRKWMKALQKLIFKWLPDMEPGVYEKLKQKIVNHWKLYEEPQLDEQGNLIKKLVPENEKNQADQGQKQTVKQENNNGDDSDKNSMDLDDKNDSQEGEESEVDEQDARLLLPLPESCLKVNLGIPIVIVVQKVDALLHGERRQFLDANFDFIQKNVREYALQYGASVIFTSAKVNKNLDVFYQYIQHRQYQVVPGISKSKVVQSSHYEFKHKAEVVERDTLFIPAGFDSHTFTRELCRDFNTQASGGAEGTEILYEDVIKPPQSMDKARNEGMQSYKAGGIAGRGKMEECADWNALLMERFNKVGAEGANPVSAMPQLSRASASAFLPGKQPSLPPSNASAPPLKRTSIIGMQGEGSDASKQPVTTPGGTKKDSSQFFKNLINSDKFKLDKNRQGKISTPSQKAQQEGGSTQGAEEGQAPSEQQVPAENSKPQVIEEVKEEVEEAGTPQKTASAE